MQRLTQALRIAGRAQQVGGFQQTLEFCHLHQLRNVVATNWSRSGKGETPCSDNQSTYS